MQRSISQWPIWYDLDQKVLDKFKVFPDKNMKYSSEASFEEFDEIFYLLQHNKASVLIFTC